MVVVMAPDATAQDVAHVVEKVEAVGGTAFVSQGVDRTIIGLVGDIDTIIADSADLIAAHRLDLDTVRDVLAADIYGGGASVVQKPAQAAS